MIVIMVTKTMTITITITITQALYGIMQIQRVYFSRAGQQ